jgi:hypothetical protein
MLPVCDGLQILLNIHYQEDKQVPYPGAVGLISSEKTVFEPYAVRRYCCMLKNPAKKTAVDELVNIID